jgi:TonB family protein
MTQKFTIFFCLLICLSIEIFGQVKIYYDKSNVKTAVLDSADYYRLCADSSCKDGLVQEFYMLKNQVKSKKIVKNDKIEGEFAEYYRNGNLKCKEIYKGNKLQGISENYHQNGKKASTKTLQYEVKETIEKVIDAWDSTGTQTLKSGEGKMISYFENGKVEFEKNYKNYELNGIRKAYREDGTVFYIETYKRGKFIEGESWDREGKHYIYEGANEKMPIYKGGAEKLYQFIAKSLEYPKIAIKNKVEGTVYVQFTVNRLGKVEKVKVIKGVPELNEEAIRIISLLPDWEAGMQAGQKVSVIFTIPLHFKLVK